MLIWIKLAIKQREINVDSMLEKNTDGFSVEICIINSKNEAIPFLLSNQLLFFLNKSGEDRFYKGYYKSFALRFHLFIFSL